MGLLARVDSEDLRPKHMVKHAEREVPVDPLERRDEYIRIVSKFTATQRSFLSAYIHHGEVKPACEQVGISDSTVYRWEQEGVEWRYAFQLATADTLMAAQQVMEQAAVKAVQVLVDILDSPNPKLRIQAADKLTKLLESSKVKKVQHEHTGDVGVNIDYKETLMRMVDGEATALGSEEDDLEVAFREIPDEAEE